MGAKITWLYCPSVRTDLLSKALASSADVVIYDLEDAVLPSQKDRGRALLLDFLSDRPKDAAGPEVHVRINGFGTPWMEADLDMLADVGGYDAVRIPKVESSLQIDQIRSVLGSCELHALVESAKGVAALDEICAHQDIAGVSLGDADLRAQLRLTGERALDQIRIRLVLALAAHGKPAPLGSVYLDLADTQGLLEHTRHLKSLGFVGRTALHPKQLPLIREGFRPTEAEVSRARDLLDAAKNADADLQSGAFTLPNGQFVDVPIIQQAKDTLALAEIAS